MDCLDLTRELLRVLSHTNVFNGKDEYVNVLIETVTIQLTELQALLEDEVLYTITEESDSDYDADV